MGRPSDRKRLKAKRKKEQRRKQSRVYKQENLYPTISLENNDAPPALVETFRSGLERFSFADKKLFPKKLRQILRLQRGAGLILAMNEACGTPLLAWDEDHPFLNRILRQISGAVGQSIIRQIPRVAGCAPATAFTVAPTLPHARSWSVRLSSLGRRSTPKGKIYFPREEFVVVVRGVHKKIAYTSHALRRISERSIPTYRNYGGMADAHALFQYCSYFEPTTIKHKGGNESLALGLFFPAAVQQRRELRFLLGEEPDPETHYYWRVGYLPLTITDEFWVAKTLLLPGFRGTPEWIAVCRSKEKRARKQDLLRAGQEVAIPLSLVKHFHRLGVPQVIGSPEPLFELRPNKASAGEFDVYTKRAV